MSIKNSIKTINTVLKHDTFLGTLEEHGTKSNPEYWPLIEHVFLENPSYDSKIKGLPENKQKKYITQLADLCLIYDYTAANAELKDNFGVHKKIHKPEDLILLKSVSGDVWNDEPLQNIFTRFRNRFRTRDDENILNYATGINNVLSFMPNVIKFGAELTYQNHIKPLEFEEFTSTAPKVKDYLTQIAPRHGSVTKGRKVYGV